MARFTLVLTVAGLRTKCAAISSLERPVATSVVIGRSRSVSAVSPRRAVLSVGCGAAGGGEEAADEAPGRGGDSSASPRLAHALLAHGRRYDRRTRTAGRVRTIHRSEVCAPILKALEELHD